MGQRATVELLAPAGNREALMGAIHAGADAVYLGGSRFGARAYADNFTAEELTECIRYAHLWGRKIYLTVNTLVKEEEFSELCPYLKPFYEAGLDGVIVQDMGVLAFIRERFPGLELHASTQMTLTGAYGGELLRELGVCRIVPSRELSLGEIVYIKERTGLAVETFVHGAMCYCYSGQCLFSSILGGRSGNRGRCAQPCRLPYTVETDLKGTGECYPLSLKDMCTIEHIPELIEAGIDSFKIEGRMKKPEYAAGVTALYRKYIDRYYEAGGRGAGFSVEEGDLYALSRLYIRSGRQDGYYHRYHGRDMVTLESPGYGENDEALLAGIRREFLEKRPARKIDIEARFETGRPARVSFACEGVEITARGSTVEAAQSRPVTGENVKRQLEKLGGSIFLPGTVRVSVDDDAFYPLGAVNGLRREAVKALEDALIEAEGLSLGRGDGKTVRAAGGFGAVSEIKAGSDGEAFSRAPERFDVDGGFHLALRTKEQLEAALAFAGEPGREKLLTRVYVEGDLLQRGRESLEICRRLCGQCEVVIALPYILRERDRDYLERTQELLLGHREVFSGVLVRSLEGMGWLRSRGGRAVKCYGDAGFYVWNRETMEVWREKLTGFCLPYELKASEQRRLLGWGIPCEKVVYGRIPMMITANCVANTAAGCGGKREGGRAVLTDRYRKRFPVELNCAHCMNIIYNSVPLSLHGELAAWEGRVDFRLDLTVESGRESKKVLEYFAGLSPGFERPRERPPWGEYTTGHERRGVE